MSKTRLCRLLSGLAAFLLLAAATGWSQDAASLGILDFRDETGTQPAGLGQRIASETRQAILAGHPGILPKMLGAEGEASSPAGLSVEQLAALGRKYGVQLVLQGGILSVAHAGAGDGATVTMILSGQLVTVETGAVRSLRVQGSSTQQEDALGQALAQAVAQLVQAVVPDIQAASPAAPSTQAEAEASGEATYEEPVAEAGDADTEATQAAQQDEELQQLIADAEATLAGGGLEDRILKDIDRALKDLSAALSEKNDLVQRDEATDAVDARIVERAERLRSALATATETAAAAPGEYSEELPDGQQGVLGSANKAADEALSLLQKIKDARALIWGSRSEDEATASEEEYTEPTEESTGEVTGVVVDEQGPVAGAEVVDEETGTSTTTGEDGAFVLPAIPFGTVARLSVVARGFRATLAPLTIVGGRSNVADIRLRKGATGILSAGVIASSVAGKARRGAGGLVRGRVLDATGRPVPRALVAMKGVGLVRTTSKGEYLFRNVPAGAQRLAISRPGMKASTLDVRVLAAKTARADVRLAAAAAAASARQKPLVLTANLGATLSGRVRDQRGRPVAGAKVNALQGKTTVGVSTGRSGKYKIAGLPPNEYRIVVSRPGYEGARQIVRLSARANETRDFQLRQVSSMVDTLRGRTHKGSSHARTRTSDRRSAAPANAALQGTVIDDKSRRPLAGVPITIEGVGTVRTDRKGAYRFAGLAPGTYEVSATRSGYRSAERRVRAQAGQRITLDFRLVPAAPLPRVMVPVRRGK